jgi:protein-glucosylgalactosylhydroxylysine glucosidase
MLYHLYSFINEYKSYGISPMGLSGLGYNGHVFWDMDLWMYPAVLALNPKLAKTLV